MHTRTMTSFLKALRGRAGQKVMGAVAGAMLIAAALALSACGGEGGANTGGTSTDSGSTTSIATTEAGRNPSVQSIEQAVSRIRGLPAPADLPVSYINRDQLQGELSGQLSEAYPQEKVEPEEKVMKYLGLIDKNIDLFGELQKVLGEGVIGYYDDEAKQLKVVSSAQAITPLNEITLAHEITHAVQDQHFDLAKLTGDSGNSNSDRDLAVLSLVEGDATMVEQEYTTLVMSGMDMVSALLGSLGSLGSAGGTPPYLLDTLEFPYLDGASFVSDLYSRNGWESVNEAYEHPPQSTEQVLHPEKYLSGEAPLSVVIPDLGGAIGPGWSILEEDTVGEFDVRELIGTELPASRARMAAAGWGGGVYRYYEKDDQPLLVVSFMWDTFQDADEFMGAMSDNLARRYQSGFDRSSDIPILLSADGLWALVQQGKATVLVLASDAKTAGAAARVVAGL